jgi:hypothetical protein
VELDWGNVDPRDDELWIPLKSEPDRVWAECFDQIAGQWESESRGQAWEGIQLGADGRAIVVFGLREEMRTQDLQAYLTQLLAVVASEAERERQRRDRDEARTERASEAGSETAKRIADELREQN